MAGKQTAKTKKQPGWLNKKEMAASIGISVQAFDKWNVDPIAKIGRETFYIVEDVIDFCVERERKKAPTGLGKSFDEMMSDPNLGYLERAELMKVEKIALENQRMKLQNAVLEGRSLPAEGVTLVLSRILSRAGEIFDGMPLKIKRKHPNLDKRVIQLIKGEVVKAQNEVGRLDSYVDEIIDDVVTEAEERIR